jgi:hypothetical protein
MSEDMNSLPVPDRVAQARSQFCQFYGIATPEEGSLMDALVLSRDAFLQNMQIPRQHLSPELRIAVEKMTDAFERLYTVLREAVRNSAAFARIDDAEQARIERELFDAFASLPES